jgi:hypothetical protein
MTPDKDPGKVMTPDKVPGKVMTPEKFPENELPVFSEFNCHQHGKIPGFFSGIFKFKITQLNDDGSIKFRTRMTIGGDRINYPFDKSAETSDLDAVKLLLNCMIFENSNWSTLDLTDFYLGTDLPHPEYIRIPENMIPVVVTEWYGLRPYIHNHILYASVHKTHYSLPQAGALTQQRLFRHLHQHGYRKIADTPSCFRNNSGTIRFSLVVDDFAVVWTSKEGMNHLIHTLRKLYQVKVNWEGNKYLGVGIDVDRTNRHVTISMPGYVSKLLRRVRPDSLKGASTPGLYLPPDYHNPSPIARPSTHHHWLQTRRRNFFKAS